MANPRRLQPATFGGITSGELKGSTNCTLHSRAVSESLLNPSWLLEMESPECYFPFYGSKDKKAFNNESAPCISLYLKGT